MALKLWGMAKVTGATGAITSQTGFLTSVTHTGAGDWLLNLEPEYAIDAAECVILVQANAAMVASGFTAFGSEHTSDVAKRITCAQEQAGGAASIAADVDFEVMIIKVTH